ncbi:MAG: NUDIX domain-containing protein [Chloroflexi bacterium]|nr:NUDIX domain-containing protein [Chloroflexota bacterium]
MDPVRFCPSCGAPTILRAWSGRARPVCIGCGTVVYLDPKLVAGVVVAWGGKLVMLRRDRAPSRGLWTFPAGYVDRGEAVDKAAVREVKEETGLEVRITGLVGVYSRPADAYVLIVYAGEVTGGNLVAGEEAQAVGLFDLDALPPLAFPRDARILEEWRAWQQTWSGRPPTPPSFGPPPLPAAGGP